MTKVSKLSAIKNCFLSCFDKKDYFTIVPMFIPSITLSKFPGIFISKTISSKDFPKMNKIQEMAYIYGKAIML